MKILTTLTVSGGLNMASQAKDQFTIGTPLENNDGNVDDLTVYANADFKNNVILGSSSLDTITVRAPMSASNGISSSVYYGNGSQLTNIGLSPDITSSGGQIIINSEIAASGGINIPSDKAIKFGNNYFFSRDTDFATYTGSAINDPFGSTSPYTAIWFGNDSGLGDYMQFNVDTVGGLYLDSSAVRLNMGFGSNLGRVRIDGNTRNISVQGKTAITMSTTSGDGTILLGSGSNERVYVSASLTASSIAATSISASGISEFETATFNNVVIVGGNIDGTVIGDNYQNTAYVTWLKLSQSSPLPAEGELGMLSVSGSNLYFHNGTEWKTVTLS